MPNLLLPFTINIFSWLRPSTFINFVLRCHFLQDQLPGEHPDQKATSRHCGLMNTDISPNTAIFPHFYTVDSSTIDGHILIIYRCFLLYTYHIDMKAHNTTSTSRGALRPLVCSYHNGSSGMQQEHTLTSTGRTVTHPNTNRVHSYLISVIYSKVLTPSQ